MDTTHYQYQKALHTVWEKGVNFYRAGNTELATWFDDTEKAFLASIGVSEQEMFDYAEDYVDGQEPDFATVAMVLDVRRYYFLNVQKGQPSGKQLDPSTLPPKDAELEGIVWLPRIIEKARAKLKGELDPDTMYGCGGDRKFLRTNDIHPAEFLRLVWERGDDVNAIVAWVKARTETSIPA